MENLIKMLLATKKGPAVLIGFGLTLMYVPLTWMFALHRKFPKVLAVLWLILFCLICLVNENWVMLAFWLIVPAFLYKLLGSLMKSRSDAKAFKAQIIQVMEATLWDPERDGKTKYYLNLTKANFPGGWRATFRTPLGHSDEAVMKIIPQLSSALALSDVLPMPDADEFDGLVTLVLCAEASPLKTVLNSEDAHVFHLTAEEQHDPYLWLNIGRDSFGEDYGVPMFLAEGGAVRQLCNGMSGSGKSSIVRQQLMFAIMNKHIDVAITDGKGSEFGQFKDLVQSFTAQPSPKDFFAQLKFLEGEKERRAKLLMENKNSNPDRHAESWNHHDDGNFLLWVWDEVGAVMGTMSSTQRAEVQQRLYAVLSVARSLGMAVIICSQTFKADILSTQIRDNCFDVSLGFQVATPQEAVYVGFEHDAEVNPSKIKGHMLRSGRTDSAGTFAMRGIDRDAYGRSYFINSKQLTEFAEAQKTILGQTATVVLEKTEAPLDTCEEDDTAQFERDINELLEEERKNNV